MYKRLDSMATLKIERKKRQISHKKAECVSVELFRKSSPKSTTKSWRRRTFRRLAKELAALTLASNKEILVGLKKYAAYVKMGSNAGPTWPFKGEDEWVSQITKAFGTASSAKTRAALRTAILAMETPTLREVHGQLAAESPEAYVHLGMRTLPISYRPPHSGRQATARILVAAFHLSEQRLSLVLLPLAPEWRRTSLDDLVAPQHSPLRPATIALARAALLAAAGKKPTDPQHLIIVHTQKGNDWLAKKLSENDWTVVDDLPTLPADEEFLSVEQHWKSMPKEIVLEAPLADATQKKPSSACLPDIPETLPDLATLRPKAKDALILALWNEVSRLRQAPSDTSSSASD